MERKGGNRRVRLPLGRCGKPQGGKIGRGEEGRQGEGEGGGGERKGKGRGGGGIVVIVVMVLRGTGARQRTR